MNLFLTLVFALVSWKWTVWGLILDLCVGVGDLEMGSMWIDS